MSLCAARGVVTHYGPMAIPPAAQRYRELVERRFGARFVGARLFGSYARGEADENSDVDVLVLVQGLTHADKAAAAELGGAVQLEQGVLVQGMAWSPEEYQRYIDLELGVALEIQREGVPL